MIINFNEFSSAKELVDAILDKISEDGYDKLTDQEKKVLTDFSRNDQINIEQYKTKPTRKRRQSSGGDDSKKFLADMTGTKEDDWKGTEVIGIPPGEGIKIGLDSGGNLRKSGTSSGRRKTFEVGDKIKPIFTERSELPDYAYEYILSKDEFVVLRINQKGKIDIGCNRSVGGKRKVFYFSTKRFEKIDDGESVVPFDDFNDWDDSVEKSLNDYITKDEVKNISNIIKTREGDTSDDWFEEIEKIGKKFYCPNCKTTHNMYDVERNEKGDKIWCPECNHLIFFWYYFRIFYHPDFAGSLEDTGYRYIIVYDVEEQPFNINEWEDYLDGAIDNQAVSIIMRELNVGIEMEGIWNVLVNELDAVIGELTDMGFIRLDDYIDLDWEPEY